MKPPPDRRLLGTDPEQYAREATRWGLGEANVLDTSPHNGAPPYDWTPSQWMAESRRSCIDWIKKASHDDLQTLVNTGTHDELTARQEWPLHRETLEACIRTATGSLWQRQLQADLKSMAAHCIAHEGQWMTLEQPLGEHQANWAADMLRRTPGLSVKVQSVAPGAELHLVTAIAV